MSNTVKAWLYLVGFSLAAMIVGHSLAGRQGLLLAFILSVIFCVVSYFFSEKLILWTYNAQELEGSDPYGLRTILNKLSEKAAIPRPRVFLIPTDTPNVFSTGLSIYNSSVAVSQGLLKTLSHEELESVLAHEISNIRHRETLTMMVSAGFASLILYVANILRFVAVFGRKDKNGGYRDNPVSRLFFALFAPLIAFCTRVLSRKQRQFDADTQAVELTQNPAALAQALWKLHNYTKASPMAVTESTAHMFIINPLEEEGINKIFTSHPPVQDRIRRLIGRTL